MCIYLSQSPPPPSELTPPPLCPGGVAAAGHVPPVPALVPAWVHPGVQGQLSGGRSGDRRHGQRLLRWGRRVLHRLRRHAHWNAGWERDLTGAQRDIRGHVAARVVPHRDMSIRSLFFRQIKGRSCDAASFFFLFRLNSRQTFLFYRNIHQDYLLII